MAPPSGKKFIPNCNDTKKFQGVFSYSGSYSLRDAKLTVKDLDLQLGRLLTE